MQSDLKPGDKDAAKQAAREAALMEAVRAQLSDNPPKQTWFEWIGYTTGLTEAGLVSSPNIQRQAIFSPMDPEPLDPGFAENAVVHTDLAATLAERLAATDLALQPENTTVQPILEGDQPIDGVLVSPPLQPVAAPLPDVEPLLDTPELFVFEDDTDQALPLGMIVEADAFAIEEQRLEALRVEEQRLEALRVEEQRLEEERLEALRLETARIEQARVEALAAVERQKTLLLQQQRELAETKIREEAARQKAISDAATERQRAINAGLAAARAAGF